MKSARRRAPVENLSILLEDFHFLETIREVAALYNIEEPECLSELGSDHSFVSSLECALNGVGDEFPIEPWYLDEIPQNKKTHRKAG